jgi:hypothetical protein
LAFKNKTNDILPTDVRETAAERKPTVLSRRRWIQLASGLLAMLGLPWLAGAKWTEQRTVQRIKRKPLRKIRRGRKRWPASPRQKNPRFVGKKYKIKRKKSYRSRLAEGFYQNPKTKVIHYVNAKRIIRGVDKINERRLKKLTLDELVRKARGTGKTHVHYSVSSSVLENAALNCLKKRKIRLACAILVLAIEHDQHYKRNRYESPSTRLYDLLAGLSMGYNQSGYMKRVRALARKAKAANAHPKKLKIGKKILKPKPRHKPSTYRRWQLNHKRSSKARAVNLRKTLFDTRRVKWSARVSSWKKRWTDKKKRLIWKKGGTTEGIGVLR